MLTSLKNIKGYEAEDITSASSEYVFSLITRGLKCVAYSHGIYGINGWLGQTEDGKFYKITKRTGNLFIVF